ncbi:MAG: hypothetical protein PHO37_12515 [Kiritimatiellae bacterium]|nr:hypothetical protein [Kiritimatiellia bacterium]
MKEKKVTEELRLEYITTLTEIAGLAIDRDYHLPTTIGINCLRSPEDAEESKQLVARTNIQLDDGCNKLRAIEQSSNGAIGIPALFGTDLPNPIRIAIAILAGKATSGAWPHATHCVGTMLQPSAGTSPKDLLLVRESFSKSGALRPHIHCRLARVIDEISDLTLRESSYRRLLALEPDYECEEFFNT